MINTFVVFN